MAQGAARNTKYTPVPTIVAVAAAGQSANWANPEGRGILIILTLANKVGAGTVTLTLQGRTKTNEVAAVSTFFTIWTAAAAVAANGTFIYFIGLDAAPTATGITSSVIGPVPTEWRIGYSGISGGNTYDMTIDCEVYR